MIATPDPDPRAPLLTAGGMAALGAATFSPVMPVAVPVVAASFLVSRAVRRQSRKPLM